MFRFQRSQRGRAVSAVAILRVYIDEQQTAVDPTGDADAGRISDAPAFADDR